MNIAIYLRISTDDKGQDTANQLLQLTQFCNSQMWKIVKIYEDKLSGKSGDRPQFQEMLLDATRGKFNAVVVWALDRFTREGVSQTFEYIKRLKDYRVDFISYTEPHFRTTGPAGEIMIAIAAWIANQERIRLVERTKAGMERYEKDYAMGRAVSKSGLNKAIGRPRKLVDRIRAKEMKERGHTLEAIAKAFGVSQITVYRVLKGT